MLQLYKPPLCGDNGLKCVDDSFKQIITTEFIPFRSVINPVKTPNDPPAILAPYSAFAPRTVAPPLQAPPAILHEYSAFAAFDRAPFTMVRIGEPIYPYEEDFAEQVEEVGFGRSPGMLQWMRNQYPSGYLGPPISEDMEILGKDSCEEGVKGFFYKKTPDGKCEMDPLSVGIAAAAALVLFGVISK